MKHHRATTAGAAEAAATNVQRAGIVAVLLQVCRSLERLQATAEGRKSCREVARQLAAWELRQRAAGRKRRR